MSFITTPIKNGLTKAGNKIGQIVYPSSPLELATTRAWHKFALSFKPFSFPSRLLAVPMAVLPIGAAAGGIPYHLVKGIYKFVNTLLFGEHKLHAFYEIPATIGNIIGCAFRVLALLPSTAVFGVLYWPLHNVSVIPPDQRSQAEKDRQKLNELKNQRTETRTRINQEKQILKDIESEISEVKHPGLKPLVDLTSANVQLKLKAQSVLEKRDQVNLENVNLTTQLENKNQELLQLRNTFEQYQSNIEAVVSVLRDSINEEVRLKNQALGREIVLQQQFDRLQTSHTNQVENTQQLNEALTEEIDFKNSLIQEKAGLEEKIRKDDSLQVQNLEYVTKIQELEKSMLEEKAKFQLEKEKITNEFAATFDNKVEDFRKETQKNYELDLEKSNNEKSQLTKERDDVIAKNKELQINYKLLEENYNKLQQPQQIENDGKRNLRKSK